MGEAWDETDKANLPTSVELGVVASGREVLQGPGCELQPTVLDTPIDVESRIFNEASVAHRVHSNLAKHIRIYALTVPHHFSDSEQDFKGSENDKDSV